MAEPEKEDYENERVEILRSIDINESQGLGTVKFSTDELTAVCPFDFGGPDFYELEIEYDTVGEGLESKSLKKYVESWRDEPISAEDLAHEIYSDIAEVIDFEWLSVTLEQARRGGIEEAVNVDGSE